MTRRSTTLEAPPILSICMPTFGRPALLERALTSVVAAKAEHARLVEIVVSDNSPDLNRAVAVPTLAAWAGPTRYIANDANIGAIANFNQGAREATGTHVMFLHDDDLLLDGAVDTIVGFLRGPLGDAPIHLFGVDVVDDRGHRLRRQAFRSVTRLSPRDGMRRVLSDSSFVRMPGLVVRRDLFSSLGGFDVSVGNPTDFDFLVRAIADHEVVCIPAVTAQYMVHRAASTTGMFNAATVSVLMRIFELAVGMGVLTRSSIRRMQADWFHQFILGGAYRELRDGDRSGAQDILGLFSLPSVRRLGGSRRWAPIRFAFGILARTPTVAASPLLRWADRLGPGRPWHQ